MEEKVMFDFDEWYLKIANWLPNDCRIAEIGIADLDSVIFLAKELHLLGKKFKLYAIDNMDYGGFIQMKQCYENLIAAGLGNEVEIVPYESLVAADMFNDGFFDFVFVDSDHSYNSTKAEIKSYYPKVKDGGIFSGHDYYEYKDGVGKAVDELIPKIITRNDIEGREFEPEQFLEIHQTRNGFGVWSCQKDFYKKLNV